MSVDQGESVLAPFGMTADSVLQRPPPPPERSGSTEASAQFEARRSEATRYLLAAAHNDIVFRSRLLRRVEVEEKLRAPSPELGVDRDMIVEECRSVRRRKTIRNIVLLVA